MPFSQTKKAGGGAPSHMGTYGRNIQSSNSPKDGGTVYRPGEKCKRANQEVQIHKGGGGTSLEV